MFRDILWTFYRADLWSLEACSVPLNCCVFVICSTLLRRQLLSESAFTWVLHDKITSALMLKPKAWLELEPW